ncbi:mucin-6-like [Paramormyrops kingsleyae]|uniref:mucin-6-like n=1 Tax=Paramormyrops kingsleyae TaxID=1676925 RepID=UPI003B96A2DF
METLVWMKLLTVFSLLSGQIAITAAGPLVCETYGSGIIQPLYDDSFYVRTSCATEFISFTYGKVDCRITLTRDDGLIVKAMIDINKMKTVLENGIFLVEGNNVTLPYDDMYLHIFQYGIYTKLTSRILPASTSIIWYNENSKITTFRVELDDQQVSVTSGFCVGNDMKNIISDSSCLTTTITPAETTDCDYTSDVVTCRDLPVGSSLIELCLMNIVDISKKNEKNVTCSYYHENVQSCDQSKYDRVKDWRTQTGCPPPTCPGNQQFQEFGNPFSPTCSNPTLDTSTQKNISTCVCPQGMVLNDLQGLQNCVAVKDCPCTYAGKLYEPHAQRRKKCRSCTCESGKWNCIEQPCPSTCAITGESVKTFDGVQYSLPGWCTYEASGSTWTLSIQLTKKTASIEIVSLRIQQETYTFSKMSVKVDGEDIKDFHQTENVTAFWQSSTYVELHTSFDMNVQVQVSSNIKVYITSPLTEKGQTKGICGNYNGNTNDEYISSSGITLSSAEVFAKSWSQGDCPDKDKKDCSSIDTEACQYLKDPTGIFAKCQSVVPSEQYFQDCTESLCQCTGSGQECLCVALESYAKACANQDSPVGDWRKATNCTIKCPNNQRFDYDTQACNSTCRSLSGPDPTCEVDDAPVDGCGCPDGSFRNDQQTCVSQPECACYYQGIVFSGSDPTYIKGQKCTCENEKPSCSPTEECPSPKIYEHCSHASGSMAARTCETLYKPKSDICQVGCRCPDGQYEDNYGACVTQEKCTCTFEGRTYKPGDNIELKCHSCTCTNGTWDCISLPCPGKCQVFGNGYYQTFDSKWYHFDGHCQYTLVQDNCKTSNSTFSITVESVPCCDAVYTCSRTIVVNFKGEVQLTLQDMNVTETRRNPLSTDIRSMYSVHTVGLYIIISSPDIGIDIIWDKNTRVTVILDKKLEACNSVFCSYIFVHTNCVFAARFLTFNIGYFLQTNTKVCGLCGNFDDNMINDLETRALALVTSELEFGNSWKTHSQPCADAVNDTFICKNDYCATLAERRCQILLSDSFKDCHPKVDPHSYYAACVRESCSCDFQGKFLGFCTAVASYAEACSEHSVCISWRTPDLCPVFCDYYNEKDECTWHYQACGPVKTCGKPFPFTGKLEGCYPKCPENLPYFDENRRKCSSLSHCTCYWNNAVILPGAQISAPDMSCYCTNGSVTCIPTKQLIIITTPSASGSTTSITGPTTTWSTTTITKPTTTGSSTTITKPTTTGSTTSITKPTTTGSSTTYHQTNHNWVIHDCHQTNYNWVIHDYHQTNHNWVNHEYHQTNHNWVIHDYHQTNYNWVIHDCHQTNYNWYHQTNHNWVIHDCHQTNYNWVIHDYHQTNHNWVNHEYHQTNHNWVIHDCHQTNYNWVNHDYHQSNYNWLSPN